MNDDDNTSWARIVEGSSEIGVKEAALIVGILAWFFGIFFFVYDALAAPAPRTFRNTGNGSITLLRFSDNVQITIEPGDNATTECNITADFLENLHIVNVDSDNSDNVTEVEFEEIL